MVHLPCQDDYLQKHGMKGLQTNFKKTGKPKTEKSKHK